MNKSDWDPNYKHPGKATVRLTLFWASNYKIDTSKKVLDKAEKMLAEHGLGLDIHPSRQRTSQYTIQIPGDSTHPLVRDNETNEWNWLRLEGGRIFDDQKTTDKRQRLPVFFCEYKYPGSGLTILGSDWLPYCFISGVTDAGGYSLIHEIIHAATNTANHCNTPQGNVFSDTPGSIMIRTHVQAIARAYFTR